MTSNPELHDPSQGGWDARELYSNLQAEAIETQAEQSVSVKPGAATYTPEGKVNEDRLAYLTDGTAVLADGVGSEDNSAPAAELATDRLVQVLAQLDGLTPDEIEQHVAAAIRDTHEAIVKEREASGQSMAAVMSLMKPVEHDGKAYVFIANVGDAPVYRLRDGKIQEITDYHEHLPKRSQRPALGRGDRPIPKTYLKRAKDGDVYILSSNGLRKNDADMGLMRKLLQDNPDPQAAAEQLVMMLPDLSRDARTAYVARFVKRSSDAR